MLLDLKNVDNLLEDINRLKKISEFLDDIMAYYNPETMTFDIPEKWKSKNIRKDKRPAESPRHLLKKKIISNLTEEEYNEFGIHHAW